jgi:type II secretory pathway pseudopilin PulG
MNYQRSFTLLETIVAIYVLLAGIVGAMNLTQQNIRAITTFRNQLIAANLAQEGAELVRSRRDSNFLECVRDINCFDIDPTDNGGVPDPVGASFNPNARFMNGIAVSDATGGGCNTPDGCYIIDPRGDGAMDGLIRFTPCSGECPNLLFDDTTGLYQYNSGSPTIFRREINVIERGTVRNSNLRDWEIISRVWWRERLEDRYVEVFDVLTPHH